MRQQESQRHGKTQPHGILEFLIREIIFPMHIDMSPRDHGALLDRCEEFLPSLHTVRLRNLLREIQIVVLWYLPEYKIVIISITYANMSLSQNIERASNSAQDL